MYVYLKRSSKGLLVFVLTVLSFCCKKDSQSPFPINSEAQTIRIDPNFNHLKIDELIDMSTITFNELIVPDSIFIPAVTKIIKHDDRYVLFDKKFTKSVYIFSSSFDFIGKTKNTGSGPSEYNNPIDISFDETKNQIVVYSKDKRSLFFYDTNANLLGEEIFPLNFVNFEIGSGKKWILSDGLTNQINEKDYNFNLIHVDETFQVLNKYFPIAAPAVGEGISVPQYLKPWYKFNNNLIFTPFESNFSYLISEDSIQYHFRYDRTDYEHEWNTESISGSDFIKKLLSGELDDYVINVIPQIESSYGIVLTYIYDSQLFLHFYSKKDMNSYKTSFKVNLSIGAELFGFCQPFFWDDKGFVYAITNANEISEFLTPGVSKELGEKDNLWVVRYRFKVSG